MEVVAADTDSVYELSDFEEAVNKIDEIETMPVVAQKLLSLTSTDDYSMNEVHDLVQSDPVVSARILKVASSPFYSSRPASSLRAALIRVGMRDLRKLILASSMIGNKLPPFVEAQWRQSLLVASISESLAGLVRTKDLDDPFLCGLLHDFGTVMMNKVIGKKYRDLVGKPPGPNQRELEREAYAFDHCDLGAMIAERWKLFPAMEHVMQFHHSPLDAETLGLPESSQVAVYVVALARHAARDFPEEQGELAEALCQRLALTEEDVRSCQESGTKRFEDMYAGLLSKTT